ncbi:MAG: Holliday junction resolvase RuvX [Clostridia bacterium]|nr:Holliday junction resolvase RuvX [Clostridia bacterium]
MQELKFVERILGIDYGDSRTGIAVSDLMGWTAQGVETITYKGDYKLLLKRIEELIKEYDIKKILIGYPRNLNGTVGPRATKTEEFIKILIDKFNLPVIKWDEWLSTVSAHRDMNEMGVKNRKKKGLVDTIAAVHILQNYLDSLAMK